MERQVILLGQSHKSETSIILSLFFFLRRLNISNSILGGDNLDTVATAGCKSCSYAATAAATSRRDAVKLDVSSGEAEDLGFGGSAPMSLYLPIPTRT